MSELSFSPPRSPRSPRSVGSRSVTISLDSPKASHTVKLSLPASMDAEPVARVAEHFAKSYNEAHPGEPPIKPNRLRLSSDADRRLVDLKSPVGAAVKDGSAYTFSEQDVNDQQASHQEQTPPPLPPRHLPFPRRCRVVGRGLVLRASPETIADRLAEFPFGAEVVVREARALADGSVRVRCAPEALLPGGAAPVVYDETGRWPCDGWAPGRVLAELSGEPFRL